MFHKEGSTVSNNGKKFKDTPIRKSDRRNLRNRIASSLLGLDEQSKEANEASHDSAAHLNALLDVVFLKGDLMSRPALLPDGNKMIMYYRSPDKSPLPPTTSAHWPYSLAPQCVWIDDHRRKLSLPSLALLSTVYLPMSSSDNACAFLTVVVPSAVSKFLCRGADLMRAGVLRIRLPTSTGQSHAAESADTVTEITEKSDVATWTKLSVGEHPAAIVAAGNPQPFAAGVLKYTADFWTNRKGVAVSIVTAYGDDFWLQQHPPRNAKIPTHATISSTGGAPYDAGDYGNVGFLEGRLVSPIVDATSVGAEIDDDDDDETSNDVTVGQGAEPLDFGSDASRSDSHHPIPPLVSDETELLPATGKLTEEVPQPEVTQDELLHRALCRALVRLKPSDFPINVASLYAQHVLPNRDDGATIELKQTRWKKFSVYLQEQVDRGLVTAAADAAKKDPLAKLTGYNKRHDDLKPFVAEERLNPKPADSDSEVKKLILLELFCIPHYFQALLRLDPAAVSADHAASEARRGSGKLTLKECRQILDDYVSRENLISLTSPNTAALDGPLTDALFKSKKGVEKDMAHEYLSRKELADAWMNKLEPAYALVEMPGSRIIRLSRGKPPNVTIEVTRRQSNKFVTRVRGLEHYGVDPSTFAKLVASRFACATTVEAGVPSTTKATTDDVLIQGNLVDELEALLTGDERLTSHGGARDSPFRVPKNAIQVELRKGVPSRKKKK